VNKKVLGIAVFLMAVAMLATPVMAAPIEIEVTATSVSTGVSVGKVWQANSNGLMREIQMTHVYTIHNYPGQDPLVGTASAVGHSMLQFTKLPPDPNAWSNDHFKTVITFTGEGTTGTFEGVGHRKALGFPVSTYEEMYQVLHGTGDFEGQTLKLWSTGTPGSQEGVLLMPK